jgi:TonB family protein
MRHFKSTRATLLFPLALLSAAVVTQANANWFHDPSTHLNRNPGSAVNPTPKDLIAIDQGRDYPLESRMFKEQGKVALKIWLTEQGTMTDAMVEHSSGFPRLDDAAVRYIKDRWHYKPANKDDPMPKTVLAEVTFKLE